MVNMDLIKMSSKGQIVIPSNMREGLVRGEEFIIIKDDERFVLKKARQLTEQMKEDLEFARRTEKVWKEIEESKFTDSSTEEYFNKIRDGS